jgi:hypothetical protein
MSASKVREYFWETLNQVSCQGKRIILHRRGKDVAALVPVEDLALIEKIENRIDFEEAERILADLEVKGDKPIPWEQVKKDLGFSA